MIPRAHIIEWRVDRRFDFFVLVQSMGCDILPP
jgi:hypothetical protein